MLATVEEKTKTSTAFVFDLLGNSSVRFEQFDGTTSLPFKSNGKFHLAGKVATTSPEIFRKVVQAITPIIQAIGNKPCIVLPPLPRYVFARCCNDSGHCINANDTEYQSFMMSGFVRLKNELIKQLVSHGVTNFKVMDSCCVTSVPTTATIGERLSELKKMSSGDGIHFTAEGYKNMASRISECLKTLIGKPAKQAKQTTYFWRGFRSRRGSSILRNSVGSHSRSDRNDRSVRNDGIPMRGGPRGRSWGGSLGRRPRGFRPYRKW
jgi:lysophospholipase L1-like esterase